MQKIEKSEKYGAVGSILFGILLILLLFLIKFTYKYIKEIEEIPPMLAEIESSYRSRGSEGNSGYYRPENAEVLKNVQSAPKPATTPAPNYAAQDIEQSIAIERAKAEEQRRQEEAAAERLRQQQEAERQQRIAAEQKAKADRAQGLASGAFSGGGTGNASGEGKGTGNSGASGEGSNTTGNPVGSGIGTLDAGLRGRGLLGKLVEPTGKITDGTITIEVTVDENGTVVNASIVPITTISDESLRSRTKEAALKTKFKPGSNRIVGKIVYAFKLN